MFTGLITMLQKGKNVKYNYGYKQQYYQLQVYLPMVKIYKCMNKQYPNCQILHIDIKKRKVEGKIMAIKKVNGQTYNRVECCFNAKSENDMELFKHLEKKSKIIGRSNYIKQLIYSDMENDK